MKQTVLARILNRKSVGITKQRQRINGLNMNINIIGLKTSINISTNKKRTLDEENKSLSEKMTEKSTELSRDENVENSEQNKLKYTVEELNKFVVC